MTIDVKVVPRASQDRVKDEGGRLKVYVTAAPEDGKANAACRKLLSEHFGVPLRDVTLQSGSRSQKKVFCIERRS